MTAQDGSTQVAEVVEITATSNADSFNALASASAADNQTLLIDPDNQAIYHVLEDLGSHTYAVLDVSRDSVVSELFHQ